MMKSVDPTYVTLHGYHLVEYWTYWWNAAWPYTSCNVIIVSFIWEDSLPSISQISFHPDNCRSANLYHSCASRRSLWSITFFVQLRYAKLNTATWKPALYFTCSLNGSYPLRKLYWRLCSYFLGNSTHLLVCSEWLSVVQLWKCKLDLNTWCI